MLAVDDGAETAVDLEALAARVGALEARNRRVEGDKAWETCWLRRALIAVLTYLSIALYLGVVVHIDPWLNAVVPSAAFLVSTLTLRLARRAWNRRGERAHP